MRSEREYDGKQYKVSIHAPVMGANMRALALLADGSFNPRTRDGCEKAVWIGCRDKHRFNPRTRDGCESSSIYSLWSD